MYPEALAQEMLANSYRNRKLAWVRNGDNTRGPLATSTKPCQSIKDRLLHNGGDTKG